MALATVKRILKDQDTVVLGSAPISEEARAFLASSDFSRLISVNGGISHTDRKPDIAVLNSREYDDILYTDLKKWPEERKRLHEMMMAQFSRREIRHLVLLPKSKSTLQTTAKLNSQNTSWRALTVIPPHQKTEIGCKAGVKSFHIAFNISAGLFGACLALTQGASSVTLCGFSFYDGYHYLPDAYAGHRMHLDQDRTALNDLLLVHKDRLQVLSLGG